MLSFLANSGFLKQTFALIVLLAVSTIVILSTNDNLYDLSKLDSAIFNDCISSKVEDAQNIEESAHYFALLKWRREYSHPLSIGN